MSEAIVVFNAGSTSLKFGAYAVDATGSLPLLCRGRIDSMQGDFVVKDPSGKPLEAHEWGEGHAIDHRTALHFVITWLNANLADTAIAGAGHRVVLGGTRFEAPVRIEGDVLDYLESLAAMEPSHQAFNVRGARAFAEAFPGLPQVACFDSAFHRTMAGGGADLRVAEGCARRRRAPLGLSRHLLRLYQSPGTEVRT
jgi:acetate kinase